ncbi:MAG: YidC/Oxa1 family membrane protein insertase [Puniceicoccales bacterium]|nr:YidC/Oxa1 family membrane protein insertase [Puniceicoccales bacterium]
MKHITTSCIIALAAFAITGCDQKKTDAPAAPEAPKTEVAPEVEKKAEEAASTAATTASSAKLPEAPKFKSDKVNAYMKDYVAFCNEYMASAKDPSKAEALQAKVMEFAAKGQEAMQELAADAEELQKYTDYTTKLGQEMAKAYQ